MKKVQEIVSSSTRSLAIMFGSKKRVPAVPVSTQLVLHKAGAAGLPPGSPGGNLTEKRVEEELDPDEVAEMLPIRKPKHVGEGVTSALGLVTGSVVAGAAGLVILPAKGAMEGGARGFASGLAMGALGAVVLPTMGVVAGSVQVMRGIAQTPFSAAAAMEGKTWDKEKRSWKHYSLPTEEIEVAAAEAEWNAKLAEKRKERQKRKGNGGAVEDRTFYELLGVAPEATAAEIKVAYRTAARRLHPDKNPDDPNANLKFQKLGEAYQVLSNEDARAKYDAKGLDGLKDTQLMDASTMYAMLFGSEQFEDLIGELQIAAMLQQAEASGDPSDVSLKHLGHKQRQREVACAAKLAAKLQPYVDCQQSLVDFEAQVREQAKELATSAFGELLTHTIGAVYVYKASQALKLNLGAAMRQKGHTMQTNTRMLGAILNMIKVARAAHSLKEEDQAKMMHSQMGSFLEGAWYVSVVDVETTVRHVCRKVLGDNSLAKEGRRKRAAALKRIGELFLEAASADGKDGEGKAKTLRERLKAFLPPEAAAGACSPADAAEAGGGDDDDDDVPDLSDPTDAQPPQPPPKPPSEVALDRETLLVMSMKELRAIMKARGLSTDGLLEKTEFVDAICAHAAEPPP